MKGKLHRCLFALVYAGLILGVGCLLVDAASPVALRAEIVEGGWRVANFVPLFLSMALTNREHEIPRFVAIPIMLCWWFVIGLGISYLIWRRHDAAA
jgi:hypothetical protein